MKNIQTPRNQEPAEQTHAFVHKVRPWLMIVFVVVVTAVVFGGGVYLWLNKGIIKYLMSSRSSLVEEIDNQRSRRDELEIKSRDLSCAVAELYNLNRIDDNKWKKYANAFGVMSLEYPANWFFMQDSENDFFIRNYIPEHLGKCDYAYNKSGYAGIHFRDESMYGQELVSGELTCDAFTGRGETCSLIKVNGNTFRRLTYDGGQFYSYNAVYNGKLYSMGGDLLNKQDAVISEIDRIIKTIRFNNR